MAWPFLWLRCNRKSDRLEEDVFEPDRVAVVLQPDAAGARHVFQRGAELVAGAVRVFASGGPLIQIGNDDLFSVQHEEV